MSIVIKEIILSDTLEKFMEKVNFNFDQLMLAGGGPPGPIGPMGLPGPAGPKGDPGNKWYVGCTGTEIAIGTTLYEGDLFLQNECGASGASYGDVFEWNNLTNQFDLLHQENVRSDNNSNSATDPRGSKPGTVNSRRLDSRTAAGGPLLTPSVEGRHIYEIITIPFPHFLTVSYEITFWTSYTQHMNTLIETFVSSYTGNRNQFKIESDKGYWFVAYPDNSVSNADNFDDFTNEQRIVRYTFNMTVPAYIVAPQGSGNMSPFRKFVSAPDISFEIFASNAEILHYPPDKPDPTGDIGKFMLSEVEQINSAGNLVESDRIRYLKAKSKIKNPFTDKTETEYLKIVTRNQRKGETVLSSRIVTKIDDI